MEAFSIHRYQQRQRLEGSIGPEYCPCGCGQRYSFWTREADPPTRGLDLESFDDGNGGEQDWGEGGWNDDPGKRWGEEGFCDDLGGDWYASEMYRENEESYEEQQENWSVDARAEEMQEEDDRTYDYYEDGIFEDDLAELEDEEVEDDDEVRDDSEGEEQSELDNDDDDDDEAEYTQQASWYTPPSNLDQLVW